MSKGSVRRPRLVSSKDYNTNFDAIDWSAKKATPPCEHDRLIASETSFAWNCADCGVFVRAEYSSDPLAS